MRFGSGGHLLAAGYPDCLVSVACLEQHLGRSDFSPDPATETALGNAVDMTELTLDYVRDAREVLTAMGYGLTVTQRKYVR